MAKTDLGLPILHGGSALRAGSCALGATVWHMLAVVTADRRPLLI